MLPEEAVFIRGMVDGARKIWMAGQDPGPRRGFWSLWLPGDQKPTRFAQSGMDGQAGHAAKAQPFA